MIVLLVIVAVLVLLLVLPFGFTARYVDGEASVAARVRECARRVSSARLFIVRGS